MKFLWRKYPLDNEGYRIELLRKKGRRVYKLIDKINVSSIEVVPDYGSGLISFNVLAGNKKISVLYQPSDFVRHSAGMPISWPFANRISKGSFVWDGIEHNLMGEPNTTDDFNGNLMHGMVRQAVWQVGQMGADQDGVFIECFIDSRDCPAINKHFGAAEIKVVYHLAANKLKIEIEVENKGERAFPMSLALHPWFNVPLTRQGKRAQVRLKLPAAKRWETLNWLPTGKLLDVAEEFDFRKGRKIGENGYDDLFTCLDFDQEGMSITELFDPASKIGIIMRASREFRNLLLYVPKDNERVVCVEPQTSATDAFNLRQNKDANLIVLEKAKKFSAFVLLEIFKG
jgi:aldose 1-epimerase